MYSLALSNEFDVFDARKRALQVASICGFSSLNQVRLATIVSDLARDIVANGAAGTVRFSMSDEPDRRTLAVSIKHTVPCKSMQSDATMEAAYHDALHMARSWSDPGGFDIAGRAGPIVFRRLCPPGLALGAAEFAQRLAQLDHRSSDDRLNHARERNVALSHTIAGLSHDNSTLAERTKKLEREARALEERQLEFDDRIQAALQSDARKGEFLAVLAHELRSPLSAVNTAADLLVRGGQVDAERVMKMGELIKRQVRHMSRLAEDLLDVSRFERGRATLALETLDLGDVIDAALEQVGAQFAHRVQAVAWAARAGVMVDADRVRLVQVFGNLLSNASRYSPEGSDVRIQLNVLDGYAIVEVRDNGAGIDPVLIDSMFELYAQAQQSSGDRAGGLGLGLALVKRMVDAHGGSVSAWSAGPGTGSTFTVRLPLAAPAGAAVALADARLHGRTH